MVVALGFVFVALGSRVQDLKRTDKNLFLVSNESPVGGSTCQDGLERSQPPHYTQGLPESVYLSTNILTMFK